MSVPQEEPLVTRRLLPVRAALLVPLATSLALSSGLLAPSPLVQTGVAAAATTGTLSVSPKDYVAGQGVRFQGNLGVSGARAVHLQSNMNRPGDTWSDIPGSTFRTDYSGQFDFYFRAPSMINISYRVVGDGYATTSYLFKAHPQEVTLTPVGGSPDFPFYRVRPGSRFTVVADTTPEVGGSWGTPPAFPGRTVYLQRRVTPDEWTTIGTRTTDSTGRTSFSVTAPASGTLVLRAREARWTTGSDDIGWFVSFPAYFSTSAARTVAAAPSRPVSPAPARAGSVRPTASGRYGWGQARYDYAWEAGQSLNSPPSKGELRRGRWRSTSDGTGRAIPFNGGLVLQSKFKRGGNGDRGSVAATLHGAARSHGRWEFRLQGRPWETGARPYRFRLELVPDGTTGTQCPQQSVLLAEFTVGRPGMRFGVRPESGGDWSGTLPNVSLAENPFNVAVEVGRDHITWFLDSNPVGTVEADGLRVGSKLVPRLSLTGSNDAEMNGVQVNSDWQRSWSLRAGNQVTSGAGLTSSSYSAC